MKKLLYSALIAITGLCAASCVQEHIDVVYDPSQVTAQTLGNFEGVTLAEDGAAITGTYNAAEFGSGLASVYELYAAASQDMAGKSKIGATIADGNISFSQKELNTLILNLGGEADSPFTLYFQLLSYLKSDKSLAIESTMLCSNVVSATFVPYNAELRDSDKYPVAYIPGGYQVHGDQGSGWVFTDEQYLYDYAGDGVYYGLLDVYESGAAGQDYGFKFTLEASWDNGDYGDAEGSPTGSEPGSMDIHSKNDGGDDNILCFDTYRYYFFLFDTNAMTLTKKYAFHNVGIVGDFNSWNAADADMKMEYNKYYHRFYIDHTFDTDAKLKFTCDDAWDTNWGVDCAGGGADIDVAAGSYRIYLDLNKSSYEFSAKMFGQEEPGAPAVEPSEKVYTGTDVMVYVLDETGWDAITLYQWGEVNDLGGGWPGLEPTVQTFDNVEYKVFGYSKEVVGLNQNLIFNNAGEGTQLSDYTICFEDKDYAFKVTASGVEPIDVPASPCWSVIGDFNGWNSDVDMTEQFPGIWISDVVELTANGWKIRYNHGWDVNFGGATPSQQGEFVQAVAGGSDIYFAGTYKVVYNANNGTIGTLGWGVTGSIASAGVSWDIDIPMNLTSDGTWVSVPVALTTSDQFKIRWNADWNDNRGATGDTEPYVVTVDTPIGAANGGKNLSVPADGTYVIVYDPASEQMSISSSVIGLIGDFNGWSGDEFMYYAGEGKFYAYNRCYEGGWKVRFNAGWDVNRGAPGDVEPYEMASGSSVTATQNGKNLTVTDAGLIASGYTICYDAVNETISVN